MAHYGRLAGVMLFENARTLSPRVTIFDAIAVATDGTEVLGSVRHFNSQEDQPPIKVPNGVYLAEIRVVIREDGFNVFSEEPSRYAFVGDLKRWTPIEVLDPSPPAATITILGLTTKDDKKAGTFEMEAEQYSLAHAEAKSAAENAAKDSGRPAVPPPKSMLRVAGFFNADSPRYKNKKFPVPWLGRLSFVIGTLAGVSEELEGTAVIKRLRLEVDDVTFVNGPSGGATGPPVTPAPAASSSGQSRFSSYSRKRARVEDAPPTSSPTPNSS
ncbi:hypothetical protein R3P38DRAFT_3228380 [Favolaschia claudopus]|uniref:Uncharacterized protein n=1 Tax=Favolaschia claudopus TaxID=2862362 RepID=A0AAV9ZRK2_9AGAR